MAPNNRWKAGVFGGVSPLVLNDAPKSVSGFYLLKRVEYREKKSPFPVPLFKVFSHAGIVIVLFGGSSLFTTAMPKDNLV